MTKTCSKCRKQKPTSEFYRSRTFADGYQGYCKQCQSEYHKNYRKNGNQKLTDRERKLLAALINQAAKSKISEELKAEYKTIGNKIRQPTTTEETKN